MILSHQKVNVCTKNLEISVFNFGYLFFIFLRYSILVFVCLLALLVGGRIITDREVFLSVGIFLVLLGGTLAILFNEFLFSKCARLLRYFGKVGMALSNLHYEIYNFRNQKGMIVKSFIYSLIIQLFFPLTCYLLTLALGVRLNPIYFFILIPIITAISALPVSIGGLGLREAGSMYFFTRVGVPAEVALTASLLAFSIISLFGLTGGLIYVLTFSYRRL